MFLPETSCPPQFERNKMSGLHFACKDNLGSLARRLVITSVAFLDQKGIFSLAPLHYVAMNDDAETANLLLDAGANPNIKSESARGGNLQRLQLYLEHPNIDVDSTDDEGMTAFHHAAREGNVDCVKALRRADADPKGRVGITPSTPKSTSDKDRSWDQATTFHIAFYYGLSNALVSYLLSECSAEICNAVDAWGWTPLHCATQCTVSTLSVALLLQQTNIDLNPLDNRGRTPLHLAQTLEALELLLAHEGVKVMAKDEDGKTPLHRFAARSLEQHVRLMLNHPSIDLNAPDNAGRSPISYAAASGSCGVFKVLWDDPRLDRTIRDYENQSILEYAKDKKVHPSVIMLFQARKNIHRARLSPSAVLRNSAQFATPSRPGPALSFHLLLLKTSKTILMDE
ncbi:ankyrin [Apiospora aurea]|uniref:Ankyrin n=1 Tax=Apiospora aurea TaxID=335848 RepID=A0ABR1QA11_9PEZI